MTLRRAVYHNPSARSWTAPALDEKNATAIQAFHQQLPGYAPTRLVSLDAVAREQGLKAVYLKDESNRLGLTSFKILGASWGAFKAITQKLGLPTTASLAEVQKLVAERPVTLFAATDGNHGRAVAHMGAILGAKVKIFVPSSMNLETIELIKKEGANLVVVNASYDVAVQQAFTAADEERGILIQDTSFAEYKEIPAVRSAFPRVHQHILTLC